EYDWIYALYKQSPAVDGRINTAIGDLKLGFKYGVVDQAYAPNAADPDKPKPEELDHFGKLLDEDDGDLLPDQRRYVADAELPVGFLTAIAEKGRHDKDMSAAATFTDWSMFGFKDLGLLGFNIGARSYSDTRDGDRQTQALRVDVSREFQLGLPLTFTVTHASAQLTNWTLGWTNKNHLGVGVAVKDYPLSDALTLNASVKTERNPIKDDKWTEPGNWNPTFKDDNDPATEYRIFNRDTVSGSVKFQATEALSFNAGYTLERRDTTDDDERDASVSTTTVGADYTLRLGATAVTLGYGYEVRNAEGFFYNGSPKSTYSLGIQRELLGATLNASYKVVVGRGSDDKEKVNATDTVAQLDLTYPIADSFEFNLSGRWGQSVGNTPGSDDHEDYKYHSVKAGLGIKFQARGPHTGLAEQTPG